MSESHKAKRGYPARTVRHTPSLRVMLLSALIVCAALPAGAHARIYWGQYTGVNAGSVGRAGSDGSRADLSFIANVPGGATAVAVDGAHVYWNSSSGALGRANLDGSGVDRHFITNVGFGGYSMAVDAGHIYWVDDGSGSIGR